MYVGGVQGELNGMTGAINGFVQLLKNVHRTVRNVYGLLRKTSQTKAANVHGWVKSGAARGRSRTVLQR